MNCPGYVALTDTTREELRERIALALNRFDQLIRNSDPLAQPPGSRWTVQQVAAHVLTIAKRYHEVALGRMHCLAETPDGVAALNQAELEAALGPVPDLADQLQALATDVDDYFDTLNSDALNIPFHGGGFVGGFTAQTNWLGELLLHGEDVARAVKVPWDLNERDMLLIARGLMQIAPIFLRSETPPSTDVCAALEVSGARPYLMHIKADTVQVRERRSADRPDAVLRTPASTLTQLLYQRIGPFTATRRGLRIVGGRRPWLALKLQSYFLPA
ncbi:maleylpyruvate isomerase N-terminal domain-containing protein [Mycobacterium sp. Z3061]|uniref:maleylpyruvate isomerase N-terminal domain-containing protein n=1 Tax=Mycobacterium sp. Z3061 TaxID=3073562 RepID=UPI0028737D1A|nr:maleylpyruvate isomerase N-terminal domain-containing protein [Mycobacterium sp. Z3061]